MLFSLKAMVSYHRLLLGSSSPRRRQLIESVGIPISRIIVPLMDEGLPSSVSPDRGVAHLAQQKAMWIRRHFPPTPDEVLLTADTVVVLDGTILGKPSSEAEAWSMLRLLSGRTHQVLTAVEIQWQTGSSRFIDEALVTFRRLSDDEIRYYVGINGPFDKAGAYGAQDWLGRIGIRRIEGSFYTVMGLPIDRVYAVWKQLTGQPIAPQ